jgi:hypothetical protein
MLLANANLYAYKIDEDTFDKVSLAFYMASGKFDRNSMSRWTSTMTRLKAQILRSSVDNSMVFVPVEKAASETREDIVGHLMLLCCDTRVFAAGVIAQGPCACPKEYEITSMKKLIAVRILATSFAKEVFIEELRAIEQSESLPTHVYKLVDTVTDAIDVNMPSSWDYAYEQNIMFAHRYGAYIKTLEEIETPVEALETERRRRLVGLQRHLSEKKSVLFPPPRPFAFEKMMKTHAKYARLFGRLK